MNNLNLPWKISAGSSCGRRALIADSTLVNIVESINDDIANHIVASVNLCNGNPELMKWKLELYEKIKSHMACCALFCAGRAQSTYDKAEQLLSEAEAIEKDSKEKAGE